jgi:hypothetical protein
MVEYGASVGYLNFSEKKLPHCHLVYHKSHWTELTICSQDVNILLWLSYEQIVSELALAMRRLHDSFVALAGRLQTVHNSVETQKEQYLNLRKYFLKDSTNVFEEHAKKSAGGLIKANNNGINVSVSPTPFSGNYIFRDCGVGSMVC